MSKASEKASAGFGQALAGGLRSRGGGVPVPAQAAAETTVEAPAEDRLAHLENLIRASVEGYQGKLRQLQLRHRQELGELLAQIQADPALYQAAGYKKFGHYITGRLGWQRSYVYRLIDLAMVRRALAPLGSEAVGTVPEGQARVLAPVVRYNGDDAARELWQAIRSSAEAEGKKVTAAVVTALRDARKLGITSSLELSPNGDSDEDDVVDAELVDDEAAELVNQEIKAAATAAEKALRELEGALQRDVAPYDATEAARDLSRIRTAALKLGRRAAS